MEKGILQKTGTGWVVKDLAGQNNYMLHPEDIDEKALVYETTDLGGGKNKFNVVGKQVNFNLVENDQKTIKYAKLI